MFLWSSAGGAGLHLLEHPRAVGGVGGLDEGRVADGVTDGVKGNGAGDAGVGHGGQSRLDLGGVGGAGGLDRLEGDIVSVVAHGGHSGDGVVAAVVALGAGVVVDVILDALIELRGTALLIEGGDIQLDVRALRGCEHLVVIERIGADEGDVDAEGAGLLDDLGGVGDGDGGEDDVRAGGLGLVQIGGEVGVVRGEGVGDDGAARGLKDLGEVADQALIVLVAVLAEAVSGLGRELDRKSVV